MCRSWHKEEKKKIASESILCHAETSKQEREKRGDIFHQLQTLEEETHTVTPGETRKDGKAVRKKEREEQKKLAHLAIYRREARETMNCSR